MAQKEITISGVGGQGMILCGTLIAKAAAIYDRKKQRSRANMVWKREEPLLNLT